MGYLSRVYSSVAQKVQTVVLKCVKLALGTFAFLSILSSNINISTALHYTRWLSPISIITVNYFYDALCVDGSSNDWLTLFRVAAIIIYNAVVALNLSFCSYLITNNIK